MSIPSSGSSTWWSASTTSSFVGTIRVYPGGRGTPRSAPCSEAEEANLLAPLAGEEVDAVVEADPVAPGAHDERVRPCAVRQEADAAEEVAVRDARRGDDDLAGGQVLRREDLLHVLDAELARGLDLPPRGRPELRLQLAAEAAERPGGQHGLPRPADSDREVVVRAADRRGDRRRHRPVLDQLDPRPRSPDLLDQVVVAGPVEDDRGHVAGLALEGVGDRAD